MTVDIKYNDTWVDYENDGKESEVGYFVYDTITHGPILVFSLCVQAKPSAGVKFNVERAEDNKNRETLLLPYVFSTNDLGTVFGVGAKWLCQTEHFSIERVG